MKKTTDKLLILFYGLCRWRKRIKMQKDQKYSARETSQTVLLATRREQRRKTCSTGLCGVETLSLLALWVLVVVPHVWQLADAHGISTVYKQGLNSPPTKTYQFLGYFLSDDGRGRVCVFYPEAVRKSIPFIISKYTD